MDACQKLLESKPEWANDPVLLIGHLSDFGARDFDQIFLHDEQLVDAYGNPIGTDEKMYVFLSDGRVPTLHDIAMNSVTSTPEALGYEMGKQDTINRVKTRVKNLLNGLETL